MIGVRNRCDISQIRLGRGVVCLFSFGDIVEQGGLYRFLGVGVVGWFPNTLSVRFLNSNSSKMGLSFHCLQVPVEVIFVESQGYVGLDGCQELGKLYLRAVFFHFGFQGSF